MKAIIIIPTYNERDNIGPLIDALEAQFEHIAGHEMHILVVDDNSPDGTAEVVRQRQASKRNLHLISGKKEGLGAAYIRGMHHAIDELGADAVFEMDADFSHKPDDVPRLLAELDRGADFVIGSRYVRGGSIPEEWGLHRKLNSAVGNVVARFVAGLYRVRDCTAGFRAIRASVLKKIKLEELRVQGYAFQVALLHEALVHGARIVEVPVDFVERAHGASKLGLSDIVEFILNAWWIRVRRLRTFLRFCAVGLSGVFVNLGSFWLLLRAGLHPLLASPIAIQISIVTNFVLNNAWTFKSRRLAGGVRAHGVRGLRFNIVSLVSLAVSYAVFTGLHLVFPRGRPELFQAAGILPAMFVNYFLNSYWTFKHVPDPEGPFEA